MYRSHSSEPDFAISDLCLRVYSGVCFVTIMKIAKSDLNGPKPVFTIAKTSSGSLNTISYLS